MHEREWDGKPLNGRKRKKQTGARKSHTRRQCYYSSSDGSTDDAARAHAPSSVSAVVSAAYSHCLNGRLTKREEAKTDVDWLCHRIITY